MISKLWRNYISILLLLQVWWRTKSFQFRVALLSYVSLTQRTTLTSMRKSIPNPPNQLLWLYILLSLPLNNTTS